MTRDPPSGSSTPLKRSSSLAWHQGASVQTTFCVNRFAHLIMKGCSESTCKSQKRYCSASLSLPLGKPRGCERSEAIPKPQEGDCFVAKNTPRNDSLSSYPKRLFVFSANITSRLCITLILRFSRHWCWIAICGFLI